MAQSREKERCTRQKGVLCFVPSPRGERNGDAVRVTEVGDLGPRRKGGRRPRPRLFCLSLSNRRRGPQRSRRRRRWRRQARRSGGAPRELARPSKGVPGGGRGFSLPALICAIGIPTPKTKPEWKAADPAADLSSRARLFFPSAGSRLQPAQRAAVTRLSEVIVSR